jgi:hypothetical protein
MDHISDEIEFGDSKRSLEDFDFLKNESWSLSQFAASIHDVGFFEKKLGKTPTMMATSLTDANDSDAVPNISVMHIAAKHGYDEILSICMRYSDINKQDHCGFTPLHYATFARNKNSVSLLVDNGASVLVKSRAGTTALEIAKALKYDEICDILESKSSIEQDPNLPAFRAWLVQLGALEYLPRFISAGYDLFFIAKHGLTAEDLDIIGIPMEKLGVRRKLTLKHKLSDFFNPEEEDEEEEDEDGDEDDDGDEDENDDEEDEE